MKTLLLWLAAIVLCVLAANWIGSSVMETVTHDPEWPRGLGKLSDVPKRYPPVAQSAAATKLVQLASAVGIELRPGATEEGSADGWDDRREAMEEYIRTQLERSVDAIDLPPAELTQWLIANAAALDAIRDLLRTGGPIVWRSDLSSAEEFPGPNLRGHNHVNRILLTRALLLARDGKAAAWDELHAAHELNRSLWRRPSSFSTRAALSSSRLINGAARKMPVPPPAWLAEFFAFDYEAVLWRAHQAGAWHMRYGDDIGPGRVIGARQVEGQRRVMEAMMGVSVCDTASPGFAPVLDKLGWRKSPQTIAAWQTLLRFRAEREATQGVLQLRSGQIPQRTSRCSDGAWEVTPTSIRFTRAVEVTPPAVKIPLEYALPAR